MLWKYRKVLKQRGLNGQALEVSERLREFGVRDFGFERRKD